MKQKTPGLGDSAVEPIPISLHTAHQKLKKQTIFQASNQTMASTNTNTRNIRLDTTLADIYRANGITGPFVVTMYCVFGHMDLHPSFPRELIYPEDEEPVPFNADDEQEIARLRSVILGLKPLRRAIGLGNMDLLIFSPNATSEGMEKALAQLVPEQRHRPLVIGLDQGDVFQKLKEATRDKKLLFWRPQGWMSEHDCLVDPQEAYDINSKKFLITSGIHTPASEIIDLRHITNLADPSSVLATRPLPFAVKLCRAGSGFGTFLVTNEHKRTAMLASMAAYKARGTTEVILSEYIDLVQDLSVHFVVGAPDSAHNRSDPLVMGVTVQKLTQDGKWVGGYIDYSMQDALRELVWDTVRDTTERLPETFVGWAGVDIVVDQKGGQWVVDLNARFTGSMPICFMSGHFLRERKLPLAQFAAFEYGGEVDGIWETLQPLVGTGQVIVTATAMLEEGVNMADIVWGGKDAVDLVEVEGWIRERLAEI